MVLQMSVPALTPIKAFAYQSIRIHTTSSWMSANADLDLQLTGAV